MRNIELGVVYAWSGQCPRVVPVTVVVSPMLSPL